MAVTKTQKCNGDEIHSFLWTCWLSLHFTKVLFFFSKYICYFCIISKYFFYLENEWFTPFLVTVDHKVPMWSWCDVQCNLANQFIAAKNICERYTVLGRSLRLFSEWLTNECCNFSLLKWQFSFFIWNVLPWNVSDISVKFDRKTKWSLAFPREIGLALGITLRLYQTKKNAMVCNRQHQPPLWKVNLVF